MPCKCGKTKRPIFGHKDCRATCCKSCKSEDMVDVVHKKCECGKSRPTFGYVHKKALCCKLCKLDDMIDVMNVKCKCGKIPSYAFPGQRAKYCKDCMVDGMVDTMHPLCKCGKIASYGYEGGKLMACKICKDEDMVNIKHRKCTSDWCTLIVQDNKYKGYCKNCFVHLFPKHKLSRNFKTKEKHVTDFIKSEFPQFDIVVDKKIIDGCSKRRPDLFIDMGSHVILVEVDEHQHNKYETTCENKRIMEMSYDIGHRKMVILRFNPDSYLNSNNEKVLSCWDNKSLGGVKLKYEDEWNRRLRRLKRKLDYWTENVPSKMVEICYLFYDK